MYIYIDLCSFTKVNSGNAILARVERIFKTARSEVQNMYVCMSISSFEIQQGLVNSNGIGEKGSFELLRTFKKRNNLPAI